MSNRFTNPTWEGFSAFLQYGANLYSASQAATRPVSGLVNMLPIGFAISGLRQRLLTTGMNTSGNLAPTPAAGEDWFPPTGLASDGDPAHSESDQSDSQDRLPGFEFAFKPLKIIFRAISIPVLGFIDIVIASAAPLTYVIVSLYYHALPLTSFSRVGKMINILTKPYGWQPVPQTADDDQTICRVCGRENPYDASTGIWESSAFCSHEVGLFARQLGVPLNRGNFLYPPVANMAIPKPEGKAWIDLINTTMRFDPLSGCVHEANHQHDVTGVYQHPSYTLDGLTLMPPESVWRGNDRARGIRCVYCYRNAYHSWNPLCFKMLKAFGRARVKGVITDKPTSPILWRFMPETDKANIRALAGVFETLMAWQETTLSKDKMYYLASLTRSRIGTFSFDPNGKPVIVLVDSGSTADYVENLLAGKTQELYTVVLPKVGTETSFASWRLVFALICPEPAIFHIINSNMLVNYRPLALSFIRREKINFSSLEIGHAWPFFMGNAIIHGGCKQKVYFMDILIKFYLLGDCYGFDELYPAYNFVCTVPILSEPGLISVLAPLVPHHVVSPVNVVYHIVSSGFRWKSSLLAGHTRENLFIMKILASSNVDNASVSAWHCFTDPRPISVVDTYPPMKEVMWHEFDPESTEIQTFAVPGNNILDELVSSHGAIVLCTFGSRGDVSPLRCIGRYLSKLGARVVLIRLNSDEEGVALLSNDPNLNAEKIRLFNRAKAYINQFSTGVMVTPHQLMNAVTLTYSLAPPSDIVKPFRASENFLVNLAYNLLGLFLEPSFNIGAYARPGYVPTSADGENFLEFKPNVGAIGSVGAWWGSANEMPHGLEHVPLIPPGDHSDLFTKYATIYTHGGAGTVALASSCGAQVVVVGGGLDREYRNPYDAGVGVYPGMSPDRIFLALSKYDFGFFGIWARKNWYNLPALYSWYGVGGLAQIAFRLLMAYLLYNRLQKASIVSTDPITSLYLLMLGRNRVSLGTAVLVYLGGKISDRLLIHLNRDYYWLTNLFISTNVRMMSSIVALWVAQSKGLFYGLVSTLAITALSPTVSGGLSWLVNSIWGVENHPDSVDLVLLEISPRIYKGVPVVHAALVVPTRSLRYEGAYDESELYTFALRPGNVESVMLFPTNLSLKDLEIAPTIYGRYGMAWNCQTGLVLTFRNKWHLLGLGGGFILGLTTLYASGLFLVGGVVTIIYGSFIVMPASVGAVDTRHGTLSILGDIMTRYIDSFLTAEHFSLLPSLDWWRGLYLPFGRSVDTSTKNVVDEITRIGLNYEEGLLESHVAQQLINNLALASINEGKNYTLIKNHVISQYVRFGWSGS